MSTVCNIDALATDLPGRTVGSACRRRDGDGERSRGDARATRHRIKRGHIGALVRNPPGNLPFANEIPEGSPGWSWLSLRGRVRPRNQGLLRKAVGIAIPEPARSAANATEVVVTEVISSLRVGFDP